MMSVAGYYQDISGKEINRTKLYAYFEYGLLVNFHIYGAQSILPKIDYWNKYSEIHTPKTYLIKS